MYHFSSFSILFYNIVQENATSSAAPKEGSPEMERNSGAGPENPGAILETETTPGATERRQETLTTLTEAVPTVPGTVPEKSLKDYMPQVQKRQETSLCKVKIKMVCLLFIMTSFL